MIFYGQDEFQTDCRLLAKNIILCKKPYRGIHGIPQGGTALAMQLSHLLSLPLVEGRHLDSWPKESLLIVDDLVDSGATISRFPGYDVATLFIKDHTPQHLRPTFYVHRVSDWITFWWEANEERSIHDNIVRMLQYIGEDPTRTGLIETPARIVRSWSEIFAGYQQKPEDIFKVFDEDGYNELVWMKDIEFYSNCEHHWQPFFGKAHVAYIANGEKVIGASKLARLVDIFARRLTTQERIAKSVTESLMKHLQPLGAACIIEGAHFCMRCRGVGKQNSIMGASCLRGRFLEDNDSGRAARAELMSLIK